MLKAEFRENTHIRYRIFNIINNGVLEENYIACFNARAIYRNNTNSHIMGLRSLSKLRRVGIIFAGLGILITVMMAHQLYIFWHDPPPILSKQGSPFIIDIPIILAGVITVIPGIYISRNIYRWSMVTPEETD